MLCQLTQSDTLRIPDPGQRESNDRGAKRAVGRSLFSVQQILRKTLLSANSPGLSMGICSLRRKAEKSTSLGQPPTLQIAIGACHM